MEYNVKKIHNLLHYDLKELKEQSKAEGFRFVERVEEEYKTGENQFSNRGEALFGVFSEKEELVALAGLNKDPHSNDSTIGRVRRFYIKQEVRRMGIGRLLINRIIMEAKLYFHTLILYTDTREADAFYQSVGFIKGVEYTKSTHYMKLGK
ncbi:GNAT family N-acetyltransferase [Alkalihalobacterium bogoriense]|uniref:GNAT family N-acetyltransferase n=1 Tax=Alkalihalobacterium bogoriense TaxID=246272 RepID=UPI0006840739|nr:GNAT family N-acetyltransferase [Alkalihalobacterium bogoriense]